MPIISVFLALMVTVHGVPAVRAIPKAEADMARRTVRTRQSDDLIVQEALSSAS